MANSAVIDLLSLEIHILSRLVYRNKHQHKHASAFKGLKRLQKDVQALQIDHLQKLHTHAESLIRGIQVERCTSEQISSATETLHALRRLCDACVSVLDRCIHASIELSNTIKAAYFLPIYTFCLSAVGRIAACTYPILQSTSEQHKSLHTKLKSVSVIVPRHAKVIVPALQSTVLSQQTQEFLQSVQLGSDNGLGTSLDDLGARQSAAVDELLGGKGKSWTLKEELEDMVTIRRIAVGGQPDSRPSTPFSAGDNDADDLGETMSSAMQATNNAISTPIQQPMLAHEYSESEESEAEEAEEKGESSLKPSRPSNTSPAAETLTPNTSKTTASESKPKASFASFFKQQQRQQKQQQQQQKQRKQQGKQEQKIPQGKSQKPKTAVDAESKMLKPQKRKTQSHSDSDRKKPKPRQSDDIDAIFDGF